MSNPVSLTANTAELSTSASAQAAPGRPEDPVTDATFSGLLQDKVAELDLPFELLPLSTDPLETAPWQSMPEDFADDGNALPENNGTQLVLFAAGQEPMLNPAQPLLQSYPSILSTPQALQADAETETILLSNKFISTPLLEGQLLAGQQQSSNMDNMLKAFMSIQTDLFSVEPQHTVKDVDLEMPLLQAMPSSSFANASTPVRADAQAQTISIPLTRPEWGNAMGERLQWMANNKIQSAEIRLDPPELGSVEIKIVIHKDVAQVNFVSPHAQVRDAVENALPRLREMFGETGLSLGDVNVSQESFKQHANNGDESSNHSSQSRAEDGQGVDTIHSVAASGTGVNAARGNGLLDTYV